MSEDNNNVIYLIRPKFSFLTIGLVRIPFTSTVTNITTRVVSINIYIIFVITVMSYVYFIDNLLTFSARNPSPAIGWASAILPALTFVGITGFLQGNTLQVLLVVAVAYGFTTVALLVPAIGAFDLLTGRSSTSDA